MCKLCVQLYGFSWVHLYDKKVDQEMEYDQHLRSHPMYSLLVTKSQSLFWILAS